MEKMKGKHREMFTWVTEEELSWLYILNQLETTPEEFKIEDTVQGIYMLFENMTHNDKVIRENAMRGLCEEGFITMDAMDTIDILDVTELRITQRGKKLLAEAEHVLEELEEEEKTLKKEKIKDGIMDILDYAVPFGIKVLKAIAE